MNTPSSTARIPLWLKIALGAFAAVLIPVYWANYGPSNFLYFCDIALLLTVYGAWKESSRAVSMAAVGILIPQVFWCADFLWQWVLLLRGLPHGGMTAYMFDANKPLFLRGLSLFHGWLPFVLIYLVATLGYDRRALKSWTYCAWFLCLVAFFLLPPAGAQLANENLPRNVNYVFGLDDAHPQTLMPQALYLPFHMLMLVIVAYFPAHLFLKRFRLPGAAF